jgi:hypothetical protein
MCNRRFSFTSGAVVLGCLLLLAEVNGDVLQSSEIGWDVLDGGGGLSCSPNFSMGGSVGQLAPGISAAASRRVSAGYFSAMDSLPPCVPGPEFVRADASGDTAVTMGDAIFTLRYLYVPGSPEPSCVKTADSDDSGLVAMSDALYILRYLYVPGEPPPPAPFPDCGRDPTSDLLACDSHPCMGDSERGIEARKSLR